MHAIWKSLAAAAVIAAATLPAGAQTTATPMVVNAPPPSILSQLSGGYPYGSSGLFFGIYTEGGGGSVNGTVPGVGSASLTDTQIGAGVTVGWAWGQKNTAVAFSCQGDFGWNNINGSVQGFSLTGPLHFEQECAAFTPISNFLSYLPNLPNLSSGLPPFIALPAGVTASNIQLGIMGGIDEDDISANFPGLAQNTQWRVAPMVGLVQMEQLSNNVAVRTFFKVEFPDKTLFCLGPVANACGGLNTQYKAGVSLLY
jgi:hypothetical protein